MRLLIMLPLEVLKLLLPCSAVLCLTSKAATATAEELGHILWENWFLVICKI